MFCSKCGKEIDDDSIFCSYCGTKTINEEKVYNNSENCNFLNKYLNQREEYNSRTFIIVMLCMFAIILFLLIMGQII